MQFANLTHQQAAVHRALAKLPPAQRAALVAAHAAQPPRQQANPQAAPNVSAAMQHSPAGQRKAGRWVPDYVEDFTVYETDFLALVSGTTVTQAIPIQADSAFKWTKATYYATIANAAFVDNTRPIPSVTIAITDTGSGRQLFNGASVPVPSLFGTGMQPFILPVERVFEARSSIQITAANFDAAVTYNLRLSFIGAKIFKYG